jgi:hypothetical protein
MVCACKGRPKCADGKKAWYEKMMSAKKAKKVGKPKEKKIKKEIKELL